MCDSLPSVEAIAITRVYAY